MTLINVPYGLTRDAAPEKTHEWKGPVGAHNITARQRTEANSAMRTKLLAPFMDSGSFSEIQMASENAGAICREYS